MRTGGQAGARAAAATAVIVGAFETPDVAVPATVFPLALPKDSVEFSASRREKKIPH